MHDKRAQRLAQIRGESGAKSNDKNDKKANEEKKPALYPNATRVSPEAQATGKLLKQLQGLQELYGKQDMAGVMAKADEIAAMPTASNYDKSFAYSLAANAAADQDNQAKAADYFRKALDSNGLDNDSHYTTMFNLAVIQYQQDKYQDALATIDRFLAESKSEKPEHFSFRADLLANLGRNDEAAAAYKALIAKNPDDKRVLMNAVAALQAADKFDQANVLLEAAYKRGMLTDGKELRALYVGYMNANRWNDARAVMEAGSSKGILDQNPQLAKDYMVLAQNAYADDKIPLAIEMYTKAGPIADDGEAYLNLAKVLDYSGKKAEAKAAAQKALDKGLKKPEEAKDILTR
ncbi:tetratricopeptide repeat protein [Thermomonas sp.]|uniref:tetratricopeptide repeat protein n=1 Tax=Thermomonas sp. TaxID=1971895 RepID=UPI002489F462|nr:tetratricopeptide repeat protein [Thermomonas sp.]MDI1252262.1 tetratricopeptide repeat protein [Thermomonas sp.]